MWQRCLSGWRAWGAAVLLVSAGAAPAAAKGVSDGIAAHDARDEAMLVGPKAHHAATTAAQQGRWSVTAARVWRDDSSSDAANWWLGQVDGGPLQDGFVRARLQVHPGQTTALVVRASERRTGGDSKAELSGLHGYAVTIDKGRVELRRLDGGAQKALSGGVAYELKSPRELEVHVWMIGPHLQAQVMDGETMQVVAAVTASDAVYPQGHVGMRVAGKLPISLSWLSLRRASTPLLPRAGAVGPIRYLQLPESTPQPCRDLPGCKVVDRSAGVMTLQLTPAAREAMLHRVPAATEVWLHEPRKHADGAFRAALRQPVVPSPAGLRRDLSYKDDVIVEAMLKAYATRYRHIAQLHEIGRSVQGRALWALRIHGGSAPAEAVPHVLINGAHHGVELAAIEFALDACGTLVEGYGRDPQVTRWVEQLTVWCVPLVNPDGNHGYWHVSRHGGRKNGRDVDGNGRHDPTDGVDLNRNYPYRWHTLGEVASHSDPQRAWYRGPRAGSEPETQAMMRLSDAERFVASVSYHTNANAILVPYTIPKAPDPTPNEAWDVAKAMADRAGVQGNGKMFEVKRRLYAVDGVDQDWHRAAHGTTALLVEGTWTNPAWPKLLEMVTATRGTWQGLLDRVLAGPIVRGRLVDAQGRPVVAEVRIREVKTLDGERWTSRCRDGRFDRLLPANGRYTADVVGADGRLLASQTFDVSSQRPQALLEWVVPAAAPATSCSRADLCAVDSLCQSERSQCVQAGPAAWCRIGGQCVARGERHAGQVCNPDNDPWGWSEG